MSNEPIQEPNDRPCCFCPSAAIISMLKKERDEWIAIHKDDSGEGAAGHAIMALNMAIRKAVEIVGKQTPNAG